MKSLSASVLALLLAVSPAVAGQFSASDSGLSLPRMVSLRSDNVNARSGPSLNYPIEWTYRQKWAPVEIIEEFGDIWRHVRDWEGSEAWIHKTRLSSRRFVRVMTPGENNIYNRADYQSKIIARVEDGVVGEIKKCPKNSEFCLIRFETIEGWLPRRILYGIKDSEIID